MLRSHRTVVVRRPVDLSLGNGNAEWNIADWTGIHHPNSTWPTLHRQPQLIWKTPGCPYTNCRARTWTGLKTKCSWYRQSCVSETWPQTWRCDFTKACSVAMTWQQLLWLCLAVELHGYPRCNGLQLRGQWAGIRYDVDIYRRWVSWWAVWAGWKNRGSVVIGSADGT